MTIDEPGPPSCANRAPPLGDAPPTLRRRTADAASTVRPWQPNAPAPPPAHRPRVDIPEDLRDVTSVKGSGQQLNIFATLAHAPNVLRRFSQLGRTLLFRTTVGDRERGW
ncbi:MAG: hypothetical protein R2755_00650 [Acidimicrobiales bacterium]